MRQSFPSRVHSHATAISQSEQSTLNWQESSIASDFDEQQQKTLQLESQRSHAPILHHQQARQSIMMNDPNKTTQLAKFSMQQRHHLQWQHPNVRYQNYQHSIPTPHNTCPKTQQHFCQSQTHVIPAHSKEIQHIMSVTKMRTNSSSKMIASQLGPGNSVRLLGLKFVLVHLERRSLDKPWGLVFSSMKNPNPESSPENNIIVIKSPSSNLSSPDSHVRTSLVRSISPHEFSNILGPLPTITKEGLFSDSKTYMERVIHTMKEIALPLQQQCADNFYGILPGDRILAIDGQPLPENKSNVTAEIAVYMRATRSFSVLVLRHPEVVQATAIAQIEITHPKDHSRISGAANLAWSKVFSVLPSVPHPMPSMSGVSIAAALASQLLCNNKPTKNGSSKKPDIAGFQSKNWPKKEIVYRNPWFAQNLSTSKGSHEYIPYDDNPSSFYAELFLQEDGTRAGSFLPTMFASSVSEGTCDTPASFTDWLSKRKSTWRRRYKVYRYVNEEKERLREEREQKRRQQKEQKLLAKQMKRECDGVCDRHASSVAVDFWSSQGFASFEEWLRARSIRWQRSYSWNKRKRQRIEKECFERVVHLPCHVASSIGLTGAVKSSCKEKSKSTFVKTTDSPGTCSSEQFESWLKVRRNQWRMSRRKRKRERLPPGSELKNSSNSFHNESKYANERTITSPRSVTSFDETDTSNIVPKPNIACKRKLQFSSEKHQEIAFIDQILEEREKQQEALKRKIADRPPIDIALFFDASKGIPDDVIVHCIGYIPPKEHGKLFGIDKGTSKSLRNRHDVWRQLCPSHWVLPRRPRKPWHELYLTRLKKERELHQKRWDDLLLKCSAALFKRDDVQKIEKIVEKAEKDFGFDLNYASGVVCERNSILNLAVIHGRHKVVRWLVDTKGANIETSDRGNFTPLLNAAWSGDRWLVRYFLRRQSDRTVRGTQHYTQGIAPAGFIGRTAEEWADKRGHHEVAKLIRLGL